MRLPVWSLEQRRPGGTRDLLELVTAVYHGEEGPAARSLLSSVANRSCPTPHRVVGEPGDDIGVVLSPG